MNTLDPSYLDALRDTRFLVVGMGKRTGVGVANLLSELNVAHALSDAKTKDALEDVVPLLQRRDVPMFFGPQDASQLADVDCVILSPGVPVRIPLIQAALAKGIPVISEVEFAYRLLSKNTFLAITGTDGKTTTTTLLGELLATTYTTHTLGNIGTAVSSKVLDVKEGDVILLELSSFQLERIDRFRPRVAAILNLSYDHLDRYDDMDDYFLAKQRIFANQTKDDILVLNAENEYTAGLAGRVTNTNVWTFAKHEEKGAAFYYKGNTLYNEGDAILTLPGGIPLKGVHNRENILAAVAMAHAMDVPPAKMEPVISAFQGVAHRMEYVATKEGVRYYNDSKATTLQAVEKALSSFDEKVILIMGGRNKGLDFSVMTKHIKEHTRLFIATGEAAGEIATAISFPDTHVIAGFEEAFAFAKASAKEGDVILFSPGCSSFDRFANYEERGDYFKSLVANV